MSRDNSEHRIPTLEGLERQTFRLQIEKIKVYNKLRQLTGLCLFSRNGMKGHDLGALCQAIVRLCEDFGARCSWSAASPAASKNGRADAAPDMAENQGMAAEPLTSCQVSVEEKIQLFSFLKKG